MAWEIDEIDSKYIVLKYYAIPETTSNPWFSIVIVDCHSRARWHAKGGEKIIERTLYSNSITTPGLFYDDIPVYFFMNNPKRYLYG